MSDDFPPMAAPVTPLPVMRAITVREPWASSMFRERHPKSIENRTWKTDYRGPLAIIAGLKADETPAGVAAMRWVPEPRFGRVVGVVVLESIHAADDEHCQCFMEHEGGWARPAENGSPRQMHHWVLENPRKLARDQVFPYTGFLGIATLDKTIARALTAAISRELAGTS